MKGEIAVGGDGGGVGDGGDVGHVGLELRDVLGGSGDEQ